MHNRAARCLLRLATACALVFTLAGENLFARAQTDVPLIVAIKPLTPFVDYEDEGAYTGFSIDLWEAIAARNNWIYTYLPLITVEEVLQAVENGDADIGIAGISITREREERLDFSQPMFNSGLQIMVRATGGGVGVLQILSLITPGLLIIPVVMFVLIVLIGHVIWLVERANPDFPDAYLPGVGEGMWWAASSLIGNSDKMPRSVAGRVGAIVWMLVGIFLIAYLTADLTTQNTLDQLQSSISTVDDLPGKRVVTVEGTTAAHYLTRNRIRYRPVTLVEDAYDLLLANEADAIVYDSPVLRYFATNDGRGLVQVVGAIFDRQDYGIAVPNGDPNRELIDLALLSLLEDGTFDALIERWFGA